MDIVVILFSVVVLILFSVLGFAICQHFNWIDSKKGNINVVDVIKSISAGIMILIVLYYILLLFGG